LKKAFEVIKEGGALPAILNASNEEIVAAFLNKKIRFCDIAEMVCRTVDSFSYSKDEHDLDEILRLATESRKIAQSIINTHSA
jgi:1-deoxy-D-xylulose-5-phosphate reductoisomerase